MGNYAGGTLLPGEYFPTLAEFESTQVVSDEDIANCLDPLNTGQVMGLYPGGVALQGEVVPYDYVQTAEGSK